MAFLRLIAGEKARERIENQGLTPDLVRLVVGASGGPKWLVLNGLDKFIFGDWLNGSKNTIDLVGSSIGAWRMTAAARSDAGKAFQLFQDIYFEFRSEHAKTPRLLDKSSRDFLRRLYEPAAVSELLANPLRNLNIVTVRVRGLGSGAGTFSETRKIFMAAAHNFVSRDALARYFDRVVFHTGDTVACSAAWPDFTRTDVRLTHENFEDALMASGSIPAISAPVMDVKGAPQGIYRDGGVIDYHFDVPWSYDDGIILYPHFYGHIIPGWFDKNRTKRRAKGAVWDQMLLLAPSPSFVERLPHGKIPDRKDFTTMSDDDRLAYWSVVVKESERLADEYLECLENPSRLMATIEPAS